MNLEDTAVRELREETGIQVYIGNESPLQSMRDCSVVTAKYDLGDGMQGTVAIVGPRRMDYQNVVGNLKTLKTQLENIFGKGTAKVEAEISSPADAEDVISETITIEPEGPVIKKRGRKRKELIQPDPQ